MRYKISDSINFSSVPKHLKPGKQKIARDILLIKDDFNNRQFFINQTTKIFIEKFNTPKTLSDVNEEIAAEVNATADKIKKITHPFFQYIKYRNFIVPENYSDNKPTNSPLFNTETILDQYQIEKIIDVSESIDIYKAVDLRSEKAIVVKLLKRPKKKSIEEFAREFNFLKLLKKTAVVPNALSFAIKENYTYFTQDFIGGLSLPQFISRKKKSSLYSILTITSNILNAFNKIHAHNIVHGDIHPSNILISGESEIKIIDFGLALNSELDKEELVNFGGAYFFMPPERIKKSSYKKFTHKPDFHSDIFQLGVVLFVLLYNKYPFNGITWEELAAEIKEKPIQFPSITQYKFLVPGWLKEIIQKCVAKKPRERFANASELYNAYLKKYNSCP